MPTGVLFHAVGLLLVYCSEVQLHSVVRCWLCTGPKYGEEVGSDLLVCTTYTAYCMPSLHKGHASTCLVCMETWGPLVRSPATVVATCTFGVCQGLEEYQGLVWLHA